MFAAEPPLVEHSGGLARVPDPILEPVQHHKLDLARAGGLHPGPGVDVEPGCEQVAECARPCPAGRDEGEVPWVVQPAHEGEHIGAQLLEQRVEVGGVLDCTGLDATGHVLGGRPSQRGRAGVDDHVDEGVDRTVAHRAHRLCIQGERVVLGVERTARAGHRAHRNRDEPVLA